MGSFKLGKMTLKSLFKKPETVLYPLETRPQPDDLKGRIDPDMSTCILCSICAKKCPTACITVDKNAGTWSIDPFACIQCRTCVRECPKDSLVMLPDYTTPAQAKTVRVHEKPEPSEDEKAAIAAKEAEKAAKIKAAQEAKAAREAAQ